jgi:hypothetical protein
LPQGNELSATLHPNEARSEDEHVGPRATIALDSGSSIHIFKDAFLLMDITIDNKNKINVRTTDSKFKVNQIGRLCNDLEVLPLPSEGYFFYPKGVANILSLAMIAETKRVVMDTAIDNAFYVFNEDGTYIRFERTSNGMYCIDINTNEHDQVVMAHQTVKGESAHFSAIDCRRATKVRELQEALACPSDVDMANAIEHNVIGNNPFTRRDVCIAKKIFGPDVPAMKGKTVKNKSKMPREDDISDLPSIIIKEYSKIHLFNRCYARQRNQIPYIILQAHWIATNVLCQEEQPESDTGMYTENGTNIQKQECVQCCYDRGGWCIRVDQT